MIVSESYLSKINSFSHKIRGRSPFLSDVTIISDAIPNIIDTYLNVWTIEAQTVKKVIETLIISDFRYLMSVRAFLNIFCFKINKCRYSCNNFLLEDSLAGD